MLQLFLEMNCLIIFCPLFLPQDMLRVIDQKGPLTKGMFIKHGNLKSHSELQKKLNFGYAVDWKKECTLVVGTIFLVGILLVSLTYNMGVRCGLLSPWLPENNICLK